MYQLGADRDSIYESPRPTGRSLTGNDGVIAYKDEPFIAPGKGEEDIPINDSARDRGREGKDMIHVDYIDIED